MGKPVKVRDAPGLKWRAYSEGRWEARWRAREDLIERGYPLKSVRLWIGIEPTKTDWDHIADVCVSLQQEMIVWANGGLPTLDGLDGTLRSLMHAYRTDPDSTFKKLRWASKQYYETLMSLIGRDYGDSPLVEIKARTLLRWHEGWLGETNKTSIAHGKIGMLRTLFGFGATIMEDAECVRLKAVLGGMRFKTAKPRNERLTADQANAIRAAAHAAERSSIALAQAIQFECMFRQKDVIGEWVPISEPGMSAVTYGKQFKWLRGIRWEEIDQNMILVHTTSKRDKPITIDLKNAPMVMEELSREFGTPLTRGALPVNGPVILDERYSLPWDAVEFRRQWRLLARSCGVPDTVRNMDSRAGAISEATDAGAELEHVRHAATHSDISMTQRYSRGSEGKIATVQKLRNESRNKPKNET